MGISSMWMHYVWALEQDYQILTFDYPVEYSDNQELFNGIAGLMEQIGIVNATKEEYQYMKELFTEIFKNYTADLDIHMTKLLADIVVQKPCIADEFTYLDGKVLLILPDEDDSFTSKMQSDLIEMMKNPMIVEHMEGGHLAAVLRLKEYVKVIHKFMRERMK